LKWVCQAGSSLRKKASPEKGTQGDLEEKKKEEEEKEKIEEAEMVEPEAVKRGQYSWQVRRVWM
jgi:hypothetical protein